MSHVLRMAVVWIIATLSTEVGANGLISCNSRTNIVDRLAGVYDETQAGVGLNSYGSLTEVFVSGDGVSDPGWSLLFSTPGGVSCVNYTGTIWREWGYNVPDGHQATNSPVFRFTGGGIGRDSIGKFFAIGRQENSIGDWRILAYKEGEYHTIASGKDWYKVSPHNTFHPPNPFNLY